MCSSEWTKALGAAAAAEHTPLLMCTKPTLPVDRYPGGHGFATAYEHAYGIAPTIDALLGYTAMKIGLDTIASLGHRGTSRADVRARLFELPHPTPMGTIFFDPDGDSSLASDDVYGLYVTVPGAMPRLQSVVHVSPLP